MWIRRCNLSLMRLEWHFLRPSEWFLVNLTSSMSSEPKRSAWTRKGRLTMIQMMFLKLKVGGSWSCLMSSIDFNEEDAQPSKGIGHPWRLFLEQKEKLLLRPLTEIFLTFGQESRIFERARVQRSPKVWTEPSPFSVSGFDSLLRRGNRILAILSLSFAASSFACHRPNRRSTSWS